ncbi:MAG: IS630 family transposase [Deltaproteobacteria bacterium]|nr:MAG: IS630 family transposase [Deltaproteobacteria bacterium]
MDEARVGLIPTYRAVWAPRGERPTAPSRRRYQWRYDWAFVHPLSGETVHYIWTGVDTATMSATLAAFAEEVGAGPHRRIVLVLDGAGWHTSKKVVVPEGIHRVFLPPYSPELQPAERLFPLINEALANKTFDSIEHLERVLADRLAALDGDPLLVSDHTRFHWWPNDIIPETNRIAS